MSDKIKGKHYTHGLTGTRVYKTWESMKARCYNPNDGKYKKYGGRGIKVCDEWLGKDGAKKFAEWAYANGFDENKHQKEQSIDRIDVNGNYEPKNCRFANAKVQANNRTNTIILEFQGKSQSLQEWADELEISESTIRWRLNKGYSTEKALTTKVRKTARQGKKYLTHKGNTKTVSEWARYLGIDSKILYTRLKRGWTIEKTLETPVGADKWRKTKQ